MLPTDNFYIYFYILLSGFITVWVFRWKTNSQKVIKTEFEYLGFSSFWGLILIMIWSALDKYILSSNSYDLFENPFSTALVLSIMGAMFAYLTGEIFLILKRCYKK